MTCKNCNNEFNRKFCNNCGQSSKVQRINSKYLRNSIADDFFQINHGFLYTAKNLLVRPGKSLKEFFSGERKNFYKPFAFLLISTTIFLFSTRLIGNKTFIDDFTGGIRLALSEKKDIIADFSVLDFITNNQTFIFVFIVPLFSTASFIAFRKAKLNFSEHLVLNLYITGEQLLIYSLFSFITDRDSLLTVLPLVLGFLFNLYVYNRFFNEINWLKRNFRFISTYFIYVIFISIFLMTLIIITTANN
mgnify:CR=1 FL=1